MKTKYKMYFTIILFIIADSSIWTMMDCCAQAQESLIHSAYPAHSTDDFY